MKRSLHIGQNGVDPKYWGGWDGSLQNCQNDAAGMAEIAARRGFEAQLLSTYFEPPAPEDFDESLANLPPSNPFGAKASGAQRAVAKNLVTLAEVRAAYAALIRDAKAGDKIWVTKSGHGSSDTFGQGIVFADGVMYEEEFRNILARFAAGVQVMVHLDCCFSGGLDRSPLGSRPFMKGKRRFAGHREAPNASEKPILYRGPTLASIVLCCACSDLETASDGIGYFGEFTGGCVEAYNANKALTPLAWFNAAAERITGQTPQLKRLGARADFLDQPW